MIARGLGELADDIALTSGSWTVVVSDADGQILDALQDELAFAIESEGGNAMIVDAREGIHAVIKALSQSKPEDVVLIHHMEKLGAAAHRQLDSARTWFEGGARVALVTTASALAALASDAPHLWSWIGSRVFSPDPSAGTLDVEARLASLREGTGLTDEEVIRRAETGELPLDPIYAEWLLLLNRGELIGS